MMGDGASALAASGCDTARLPRMILASLDSDGRQHLDRTPAGPGA